MSAQKIDGARLMFIHRIFDRKIRPDHLYTDRRPGFRIVEPYNIEMKKHAFPQKGDDKRAACQFADRGICPMRQIRYDDTGANSQCDEADSGKLEDIIRMPIP